MPAGLWQRGTAFGNWLSEDLKTWEGMKPEAQEDKAPWETAPILQRDWTRVGRLGAVVQKLSASVLRSWESSSPHPSIVFVKKEGRGSSEGLGQRRSGES